MDRLGQIDWNQIRALLATVEAGSLSAAAKRLGLTQPTLGRQVAALERALGVTLFERVGRSLVLTQAGQDLVEPLHAMGVAAERLALTAALQSQGVDGLVRITASDIYAAYVLPPMLERLKREAPGIVLDVMASNTINDLIRREADIAIRHVRPDQEGLIARRCPDTRAWLYGAEGYYRRFGRPKAATDFGAAEIVGYSDRNDELIAGLAASGVPVAEENFRWITNSGVVAWEWVRQGLALGVMMEAVGAATPDVDRAWPAMAPIPVPVWLVTHRELHTSRRIRLVFDLLAEYLAH